MTLRKLHLPTAPGGDARRASSRLHGGDAGTAARAIAAAGSGGGR